VMLKLISASPLVTMMSWRIGLRPNKNVLTENVGFIGIPLQKRECADGSILDVGPTKEKGT